MMACVRCEIIRGSEEMPMSKKTLPYPVTRGLLKIIGKHRILGLVEKIKKGEPVEEKFLAHFGLQMLRRNHLAIFSDSDELPSDVGRKMGLARSYADVRGDDRLGSDEGTAGSYRLGLPLRRGHVHGSRPKVIPEVWANTWATALKRDITVLPKPKNSLWFEA